MDAAKARAIIEKLQQDLVSVNDQNFQSFHTKLKSYTSSIFGKDSEEYKFANNHWLFVISMIDESYSRQIIQNKPRIEEFLKDCLESIDLGIHQKSDANTSASFVLTGNNNNIAVQSSLDKSFNAEANSKTPIKKSKTDWELILKITAGIIAIVLAVLKGFGVI